MIFQITTRPVFTRWKHLCFTSCPELSIFCSVVVTLLSVNLGEETQTPYRYVYDLGVACSAYYKSAQLKVTDKKENDVATVFLGLLTEAVQP